MGGYDWGILLCFGLLCVVVGGKGLCGGYLWLGGGCSGSLGRKMYGGMVGD